MGSATAACFGAVVKNREEWAAERRGVLLTEWRNCRPRGGRQGGRRLGNRRRSDRLAAMSSAGVRRWLGVACAACPPRMAYQPAGRLPAPAAGARGCWSGGCAWRPAPTPRPGGRWRGRSLHARGSRAADRHRWPARCGWPGCGARNQRGAQMIHDVREVGLPVAWAICRWKRKSWRHGIAAFGHAAREIIERAAHGGEVFLRAPLRGQARGFRFQADAQLEHRQHVHRGRQLRRVEPNTPPERGGSTKVPMPWRVSTKPAACILDSASRTTVRLTSCSRMSSVSVGSLSPGLSARSRICAQTSSTSTLASPRTRFAGALAVGLPAAAGGGMR